jgi:hypothetical protein
MRYSIMKALLCAISILLCCHCKTAYQSTGAAVEVPPECEEFKTLVLAEWKEKKSQEGRYYEIGDNLTSFIQLNGVSSCFQSLDTTKIEELLGRFNEDRVGLAVYYLKPQCNGLRSPCAWLTVEYDPRSGNINRLRIRDANWID